MFDELKKKIEELDGIISCKITGENDVDEIHILASKDREPKRIVRDIETLTLIELDRQIDHKKISIASINQTEGQQEEDRIVINSIYQVHNKPVCHLNLYINDNLVEKEISGLEEEPIALIVSRGLIELIEEYTDFGGKFRVENVFTTGFNDQIVIVQLVLYKNKGQERLLGAAYIEHNLPLAIGKACLKALNRRIGN